MNIATTREQSARLLQCGVSADTADMHISNYNELWAAPYKNCQRKDEKGFAPAWSLSALLGLLPKHLDDFPYTKWIPPFLEGEIWDMDYPSVLNGGLKLYSNGTNWIVNYDWDGFLGTCPQSENPIEACVLAIELLTANGYKLN